MNQMHAHIKDHDFSDADFSAIAGILHRETGIFLGDHKKNLVYARLSAHVQRLGFTHFADYIRHIGTPPGQAERQDMISTLTTNVTGFYREPHHFKDFSTRLLPDLLAQAKRGERVRIWSSACSSGEEPYTIAFEVLKQAPEAERYDLKILATDIDPVMVSTAEQGHYSETVAEAVPNRARQKFMPANQISPTVKSLVTFRQLNLLDPLPFSGAFDVIFCRNVTIYFDPPTRNKTWQQIVSVLKPGGQLYAGHSERVSGPAASLLKNNGLTAYTCIK